MVVFLQDWVSNVAGKQAAYHAVAEYYQGVVAKEKKEFGEEIARLAVSSIQCGLKTMLIEKNYLQ